MADVAAPSALSATSALPTSRTYSVTDILRGMEKRGLSVTLNAAGNGLHLHGPQSARTDRIREALRAAKPALIAYLLEQKQRDLASARAKRRAALVAEFGEELIRLGEQVEDDLVRQNTERDAEVTEVTEVAEAQEYGDAVRAVYKAALQGSLPGIRVELGPGRAAADPNQSVLDAVQKGRLLQAKHGNQWRTQPGGEQIAADIEALADWYRQWYWSTKGEGGAAISP